MSAESLLKNLLRSGSRVPAVLGILMYLNIHSGSCAPAERDLPSLANDFFTSSGAGGFNGEVRGASSATRSAVYGPA